MEWHRIAYFVPMVPLRIYSLTHSPPALTFDSIMLVLTVPNSVAISPSDFSQFLIHYISFIVYLSPRLMLHCFGHFVRVCHTLFDTLINFLIQNFYIFLHRLMT